MSIDYGDEDEWYYDDDDEEYDEEYDEEDEYEEDEDIEEDDEETFEPDEDIGDEGEPQSEYEEDQFVPTLLTDISGRIGSVRVVQTGETFVDVELDFLDIPGIDRYEIRITPA